MHETPDGTSPPPENSRDLLDRMRRRHAWATLDLGPLWVPRMAPQPPGDESTSSTSPEGLPVQPASGEISMPAPEAFPSGGEVTADAPDMPAAQRWIQLRQDVAECQRCRLASTRTHTVFGRGASRHARWLLIGEAPGAEEDRQGEAFVGQAGKLLDAMLDAAGINPDADVFIANVLKCRPPDNRDPQADEVAACTDFLHAQIRLVHPDCILLLGRFAAQSVLHSDLQIGRLRNKVHHITLDGRSVPVVVTYHPAYLLRNPKDKIKSWEDLCLALSAVAGAGTPEPG